MNHRISEASKRLGVHQCTLRNLEKKGMIKVRRDWAGYRIYSESDIKLIEEMLFQGKIPKVKGNLE